MARGALLWLLGAPRVASSLSCRTSVARWPLTGANVKRVVKSGEGDGDRRR
jgi:hypothetical protein